MSHVVNPNALRLGHFNLTWSYAHKFSEVSKIVKLHLELNYLLNFFLRVYGFSIVKYHLSFERNGLKLNVVLLRYVFSVTNQKIFTYFRDDVRTINNPFTAVTKLADFSANTTDMKFLFVRRNAQKLRKLGLSRDVRRWDLMDYAWYTKIDSISEQRWGHPSLKFLRSYDLRNSVKKSIKKKLVYFMHSRRMLASFNLLAIFKLRRLFKENWFDEFEKFARVELNKFYFSGFRKGFFLTGSIKDDKAELTNDFVYKMKNRLKTFISKKNYFFKKLSKRFKFSSGINSYIKKIIKMNLGVLFLNSNYTFIKSFFNGSNVWVKFNILFFFNSFLSTEVKRLKNKFKQRALAKIGLNANFNKIYLDFYRIPKKNRNKLFNNFFLKNVKLNLVFFHNFLRDKLILLSMTNVLLDKFNLVFFINIYNAASIFKDTSILQDLYANLSMVRRWTPARGNRVYSHLYVVLLVSIRLRITGPISTVLALLLNRNITHYKILFCFRNIMTNLELTSEKFKDWRGIVVDAVGRVNGSDRKKYCRYSSSRMYPLSTFDSVVIQSNKRAISKYGLVNVKVLSFWDFI